jgi:hypothetical protein
MIGIIGLVSDQAIRFCTGAGSVSPLTSTAMNGRFICFASHQRVPGFDGARSAVDPMGLTIREGEFVVSSGLPDAARRP